MIEALIGVGICISATVGIFALLVAAGCLLFLVLGF